MATDTTELVVPLRKANLAAIVVGAAVFVALGVWLWKNAEHLDKNPIFVQIVAIVTVGFFGACGLGALGKLVDRAPGLIVDAEGIVDNSSGVSAGRIPWADISELKMTSVETHKFLTIKVRNPETYVRRANAFTRLFVSTNAKYFGGPIHISADNLKIDFDRLTEVVTAAHAKYRKAHAQR